MASEASPITSFNQSMESDSSDDDQTISSLFEKTRNNLERSYLIPMPDVPSSRVSREFDLEDHLNGVEITSLDITPHGCSVLAGCSNGLVLLFDMTSPSRKGVEVAYIRAKGMHTNLLVTVKITEDCRFGFIGVLKGSQEMIAIDLSRLPFSLATMDITKKRPPIRECITSYSYLDSKLRGFGAVCRVKLPSDSNHAEYRLLCGRGIKNIHIWSFIPDATGLGTQPQWVCIYDMATNGNTIETMAFRRGGNEVLSKSAGMCIRLWDLTTCNPNTASTQITTTMTPAPSPVPPPTPSTHSPMPATPLSSTPNISSRDTPPDTPIVDSSSSQSTNCVSTPATSSSTPGGSVTSVSPSAPRPAYVDIALTQDIRAILAGVAYGGTYEFAVVQLDAPVSSNKVAFELPARNIEDDNGQRRKRMMRQIQDVTGTQDGAHVLILCTDGSVLYYSPLTPEESSTASAGTGAGTVPTVLSMDNSSDNQSETVSNAGSVSPPMTEICSLQRDPDTEEMECAWALKKVGRGGLVVLLRGYKPPGINRPIIKVTLLSDLVPERQAAFEPASKSQRWFEWDCYRSPRIIQSTSGQNISSLSGGSPSMITATSAFASTSSSLMLASPSQTPSTAVTGMSGSTATGGNRSVTDTGNSSSETDTRIAPAPATATTKTTTTAGSGGGGTTSRIGFKVTFEMSKGVKKERRDKDKDKDRHKDKDQDPSSTSTSALGQHQHALYTSLIADKMERFQRERERERERERVRESEKEKDRRDETRSLDDIEELEDPSSGDTQTHPSRHTRKPPITPSPHSNPHSHHPLMMRARSDSHVGTSGIAFQSTLDGPAGQAQREREGLDDREGGGGSFPTSHSSRKRVMSLGEQPGDGMDITVTQKHGRFERYTEGGGMVVDGASNPVDSNDVDPSNSSTGDNAMGYGQGKQQEFQSEDMEQGDFTNNNNNNSHNNEQQQQEEGGELDQGEEQEQEQPEQNGKRIHWRRLRAMQKELMREKREKDREQRDKERGSYDRSVEDRDNNNGSTELRGGEVDIDSDSNDRDGERDHDKDQTYGSGAAGTGGYTGPGRRRKGLGNMLLKKKKKRLELGPPPVWKHFTESAIIYPRPQRSQAMATFIQMRVKWLDAMTPEPASVEEMLMGGSQALDVLSFGRTNYTLVSDLSVKYSAVSTVLRAAAATQDQLLGQFAIEVIRLGENELKFYSDKELMTSLLLPTPPESSTSTSTSTSASGSSANQLESSFSTRLQTLLAKTDYKLHQLCQCYHQLVLELVQRQGRELTAAIHLDYSLTRGPSITEPLDIKNALGQTVNLGSSDFHIRFRHIDMFGKADIFGKALRTLFGNHVMKEVLGPQSYGNNGGGSAGSGGIEIV